MKGLRNYLALFLVLLLSACGASTEQNQQAILKVSNNVQVEQTGNAEQARQVEVHFLDVGQADSTLIKLPTGENILIDGGNQNDKEYILNYLARYDVQHLDIVVATHPHEDHIGSLKDVISSIKTDTILLPAMDADTIVYTNLLYAIEENEVKEEQVLGQSSIKIGDVTLEILGPVKEYNDKNNASIVIKMIHGDNNFLFTGDIEKEAETDILESGVNLKSDVLKVPHHGSKTSSTTDFLNAVSPNIAVIHVGVNNEYGLPSEDIIEKLNSMNLDIYRTDLNREIIIYSDGKKIEVKCGFETFHETSLDDVTSSDGFEEAINNDKDEVDTTDMYIGNLNSKIYHYDTCGSLPAKSNQIYFQTNEEAEQAGYVGHKNCIK